MTIKPLEDRIIIKQDDAQSITESGLIIPPTAQHKPLQGEIIAHGPGKKGEPISVKRGDRVLFHESAGTEIELDGNPYLFMRESDVWAIL
jgi:chaperonin GroES